MTREEQQAAIKAKREEHRDKRETVAFALFELLKEEYREVRAPIHEYMWQGKQEGMGAPEALAFARVQLREKMEFYNNALKEGVDSMPLGMVESLCVFILPNFESIETELRRRSTLPDDEKNAGPPDVEWFERFEDWLRRSWVNAERMDLVTSKKLKASTALFRELEGTLLREASVGDLVAIAAQHESVTEWLNLAWHERGRAIREKNRKNASKN